MNRLYVEAMVRAAGQGVEVARTFYPLDGSRSIPRDMRTGKYRIRVLARTQPHHRADLCGPFGRTMP